MSESPKSIAQHYHERTKYDPETLALKSQTLDWEKQPIPFKEYKIGKVFDLKLYLKSVEEATSSDPKTRLWQRLSHLLLHSYGLTAKLPTMGGVHYLRAAPSAGGLYPAEIYLISRGTAILAPGLYHYQPQTHALVQFWEDQVWHNLRDACFWHPVLENTHLALVTTAVFYRSFWRYQDRAYRRICLDTGHLLGNLELMAAMNDYRPHLIGGFADDILNQLLYLDPEVEGVTTVLALANLLEIDENLPHLRTALPSETQIDYPNLTDGELLAYLHQATKLKTDSSGSQGWKLLETDGILEDKYNFPFCTKVATVTSSIDWGKNLSGLERIMVKRRSTRAYNGAELMLNELLALLDFTYQPHHYIHQGLDGSPDYFDLSLIETFIAVSGVNGLEDGCYYYAPKAQELRQIRFKNFRRELYYLCLQQDLGRDAAVVLFHTADLKKAIANYGDRVYRYLHLDAGHLGQRLNLAAIYLRLGVSGIGGFFDNQVNEVLGIPTDEAVLYITTLGRPR
ncbi:SagB/ThcOx family dehydrogenase [Planktothrix sp. FACHB-1365]|uniref:SagB/ThcOx family dehydrogenase n=1 Tax=Planktothrix sp. FACHB-1365 TaxID=2692855 RepID=UPI001685A7E1|nr:SagB/ThcOx family dehydrogenase [Planktothrix sp. FACHB-1365]MBD2485715.1 SagB/ThcOx family dehydrogenase [Planktothrix sp. FACHB-1365]